MKIIISHFSLIMLMRWVISLSTCSEVNSASNYVYSTVESKMERPVIVKSEINLFDILTSDEFSIHSLNSELGMTKLNSLITKLEFLTIKEDDINMELTNALLKLIVAKINSLIDFRGRKIIKMSNAFNQKLKEIKIIENEQLILENADDDNGDKFLELFKNISNSISDVEGIINSIQNEISSIKKEKKETDLLKNSILNKIKIQKIKFIISEILNNKKEIDDEVKDNLKSHLINHMNNFVDLKYDKIKALVEDYIITNS